MNKTRIQEIEFKDVEAAINNKIHRFVDKYNKYPKYLKLPLWLNNYIKQSIQDVKYYNLDYSTGLFKYKDLVVCETITISQLEEIEVF